MKPISEFRSLYHWRLFKRGGPLALAALVAAVAAGALFFAVHHGGGWRPMPGPPPLWALLVFVALVLASGLLWWRFSSFQDEMFHRIQNYSYGRGAILTVAVLVVWGLGSWAALLPPIHPLAPVLIFAIAKGSSWTRAVRTWL